MIWQSHGEATQAGHRNGRIAWQALGKRRRHFCEENAARRQSVISGNPACGDLARHKTRRGASAHILAGLLPARRLRTSPRIVKRAISKYQARGPKIARASYKATISIDILAPPEP